MSQKVDRIPNIDPALGSQSKSLTNYKNDASKGWVNGQFNGHAASGKGLKG